MLTVIPIYFIQVTDQFDPFLQPETRLRKIAKKIPPLVGQFEKHTSFRGTDVV